MGTSKREGERKAWIWYILFFVEPLRERLIVRDRTPCPAPRTKRFLHDMIDALPTWPFMISHLELPTLQSNVY